MRKLSFFLAFALVLSLAYGALAQTHHGIVSVDNALTAPKYSDGGTDYFITGTSPVIAIRFNALANNPAHAWTGSNAWEIYSYDGADWMQLTAAEGPVVTPWSAAVSKFKKYYTNTTGGVSNWVSTGGGTVNPNPPGGSGGVINNRVAFSFAWSTSVEEGVIGGVTNDIAFRFTIQARAADSGKHICVDTVGAKGTVAWEWASAVTGSDFPQWDNGLGANGARCWQIVTPPNFAPVWNAPTGNVSFNHCGEGQVTLAATDEESDPITYAFAPGYETGFGTITGNLWKWSGTTVPQAGTPDVLFVAMDPYHTVPELLTPFTLHVTTTNNTPTLTCPAVAKTISIGTTQSQVIDPNDLDVCDALTVTVVAGVGYDVLQTNLVNNGDGTFTLSYSPTAVPVDPYVHMNVEVFDGLATGTCVVEWYVIAGAPYQIEIEKVKDQYQGQYADVFVKLHKINPLMGLGGFDLLIAYDASALAFQMALEGDIYDQCNWEYFTYRFGPYGNCGNACPSGMLRIVGLAETNNGAVHPGCNIGHVGFVNTVPVTLADLRFLVTNDRTLECQFVPIRFFWYNCGDNVLSNYNGSELYLSQKVFDFFEYNNPFLGGEITAVDDFPTYLGAQEDCVFEEGSKVAKRNVDFQNGGIDIVCADSIDAPGDINLNGTKCEIGDAVMFTNYFVSGLAAFGTHVEGSIAASDVNKDGISLSVADLVYLIRVIVGDVQAYEKLSPVAARVTVGNGVFSVSESMGAAHVVIAGNVTPRLLAEGMEMQYGFNGQNTSIIIWSREGNSFSGDFLAAEGDVVSSEFAAFNGAPVTADVMPSNFELHQNYPNPFNPVTNIKIEIPGTVNVNWKLNVYNVTGQLVQSFTGASHGYQTLTWDASNVSSGVYFYKLTAGDYTATKKAVLLK